MSDLNSGKEPIITLTFNASMRTDMICTCEKVLDMYINRQPENIKYHTLEIETLIVLMRELGCDKAAARWNDAYKTAIHAADSCMSISASTASELAEICSRQLQEHADMTITAQKLFAKRIAAAISFLKQSGYPCVAKSYEKVFENVLS